MDAGFVKNEYEMCVYNKRNANGVQCTVAVHVDDLIITSESDEMISDLKGYMKNRYGEITSADGPVLNYLGMVFDLSIRGQVKMTMQGYVEDTIAYSGIVGHSKSAPVDCSTPEMVRYWCQRRREHGSIVWWPNLRTWRSVQDPSALQLSRSWRRG